MFGISKPGFTLIEILVAIVIIALMATVVVPNLNVRKPKYEREQFIRNLNALSTVASQLAIVKNKIFKIVFDFKKNRAHMEQASEKNNDKGEPIFEPVKGAYVQSSVTWPRTLEMKNFYVQGFDEMSRFVGGSTTEVWYFIYPNGRSQAVVLNMVDSKDRVRNRSRQFSLVLNPFSALFKEYDTFQK